MVVGRGLLTQGNLLAYPNMCKHRFTGGCTVNLCHLCDLSRQTNDEHDGRLLKDKERHSLPPPSISIAPIQIVLFQQNASTYIIHPLLSTLLQPFLSRLWRPLDVITQQQKEASQGGGFIYIQKRSEVYSLALSRDGKEGDNCEDRDRKSDADDPLVRSDWSIVVSEGSHVCRRRTASAPRDWSNASHAS